MKTNRFNLTFPTKLTAAGLIACAVTIWIQWLSGDPAYPKFPPGPVFFMAVAAIVVFAARWWWTPFLGALIGILVTGGWFALLPREIQRLTHPESIGHFAPGIFIGTLGQILSLLLLDVAGVAATIINYRRTNHRIVFSNLVLRLLGAIFLLTGIAAVVSKLHVDWYHNLMHMVWGALAIGATFLTLRTAKRFCIVSGLFYLSLAFLGLILGDAATDRAWHAGPILLHTADDIFHLVLGCALLVVGVMAGRESRHPTGIHDIDHLVPNHSTAPEN